MGYFKNEAIIEANEKDYRICNIESALTLLIEAIRVEKLQPITKESTEAMRELSKHHQKRAIELLQDNF